MLYIFHHECDFETLKILLFSYKKRIIIWFFQIDIFQMLASNSAE